MIDNKFGLKDFYWFYILTFIVTPIGLLIRIFYSKTLPLEVFAFIYGIINFFNLVNVLTNFGINFSIGYYIPKFIVANDKQSIRNSLAYMVIFYLFQIFLFTIVLYLLRNFIAVYYFNDARIIPFLVVMLIFFIGNIGFSVLQSIFIAFKMNVALQGMVLIKLSSIFIMSFLVFLIWGDSLALGIIFAYIWGIGTILAILFYSIYFYLKYNWVIGKITRDFLLAKGLFIKGFEMFISSIGVISMAYIDVFLITLILGVVSAGIYDTMISLIRILPLLISAIAVIFIPLFSELQLRGEYDLINRHLNLLYGLGVFIIAPLSLTILIFSDSIIKLLYSAEFLTGAVVLTIFAMFGVFRVIGDFNRSIMNGLGLSKRLIVITFLVAAINLLFDLLLIPIMGLGGAALVTGFGWMIYVVLTTFYIAQNTKFNLNFKKLVLILFDSSVFLIFIYTLKLFINTGNLFIDGILIIIPGMIVYALLGNYLKILTFNDILLFVPESFIPILKSFKSKYFNYMK